METGVWPVEMAQSVKHKHEDLRTDTQNLSQKRSVAEHTHDPSAVEAEIGGSLRLTGQPVQLNQ